MKIIELQCRILGITNARFVTRDPGSGVTF